MEGILPSVTIVSILFILYPGAHGLCKRECPTRGFDTSGIPFLGCPNIANGKDAQPGRYPYMTSLQRSTTRTHFCGAMLIEEDILLTAAQCVDPRSPNGEPFPFVQVGGIRLVDDHDAEPHEVCRTIIHRGYQDVPGQGFDIALLQLVGKSLKLPVKLLEEKGPAEGVVTAIGWGRDRAGTLPVFLETVEPDITDQNECREVSEDALLDSMICAKRPGQDVCQVDSGGPLIVAGEGCGANDRVVGITSFGFSCRKRDITDPGVYTNVTYFLDWIKKHGAGEASVFENSDCKKLAPKGQRKQVGTVIPSPPLSLGGLAPAKDEGGCVYVEGIDFGKGPLPIERKDVKDAVFDTPQECCDLCKRTPGCRTWTYIRVQEVSTPKGACILRFIQAPATRCSICTSGLVKKDFLNEPETSCFFFLGMDLYGKDLREIKVKRVEACCKKCKMEKKCRSFTFTMEGRCFLKSGIGEPTVCGHCQAGIIAGRVRETDNIAVLNELLPGEDLRIHHLKQTTTQGVCRYTIGVDMNSNGEEVLVDGKRNIANTPEDCCKQCRNTPDCRSWTMITVPTRKLKRGACFLSSNIPKEVPCAACTSGVVQGGPCYQNCFLQPNYLNTLIVGDCQNEIHNEPWLEHGTFSSHSTISDLFGRPKNRLRASKNISQCSLLEGVDLQAQHLQPGSFTDSPEECCDKCRRVPKCKSWTRVRSTKMCYLKGAAYPMPKFHAECDSGVLIERVASRDKMAGKNP